MTGFSPRHPRVDRSHGTDYIWVIRNGMHCLQFELRTEWMEADGRMLRMHDVL